MYLIDLFMEHGNRIYVSISISGSDTPATKPETGQSPRGRKGGGGEDGHLRKEMFYLTTHSTHFIYGYMASDVW